MSRFVIVALWVVAACGTDDVNAAGNYTIALTSGANGCNLSNWTVGGQTTGIAVGITQSGKDVTATVAGLAGGALDVVLGSHVFAGTVSGDSLDMTILGTVPKSMGNCTYTFNSEIPATLSGDALSGSVEYRAATNGNPDCATLVGCLSVQQFNGSRPP